MAPGEIIMELIQEPTYMSNPLFFLKGAENVLASSSFDEDQDRLSIIREQLTGALNVQNVAFLLGSGCSSHVVDGTEVGIPTMQPLAQSFINKVREGLTRYPQAWEALQQRLGLRVDREEYQRNLERLLEVLYGYEFAFMHSSIKEFQEALATIREAIIDVKNHILTSCLQGRFAQGDSSVLTIYEMFYRKLIYRDRALSRPWIFTTNYDLFNELAMDRLGISYCNGFSGVIERRFNPSLFRYTLAEQLDITSKRWSAVDNYIYFCKLHGSVNWFYDDAGLFPIREDRPLENESSRHAMIYPTPAKQNLSLGSPYAELIREFQSRIVRQQSVLFVIGYGFGDEHINNILFQALTVPSFRLIALVPDFSQGIPKVLKDLEDPRVWLIGGIDPENGKPGHYFETFVREFMPELPGDKIDSAIRRVIDSLVEVRTSANEGNQ